MLNGVTLVVTGFTVLTLSAGQVHAAPATRSEQASTAGKLVMSNETSFMGDIAVIREEAIPTVCDDVPFGTVRSVANATTGTRISRVEFYSDARCANRVATLTVNAPVDPDLPPAAGYRGFTVSGQT